MIRVLMFFLLLGLAACMSPGSERTQALLDTTQGIATETYAIADAFDEFLGGLIDANPDQPKLAQLRGEVKASRDRVDDLVTALVAYVKTMELDAVLEGQLLSGLFGLLEDGG